MEVNIDKENLIFIIQLFSLQFRLSLRFQSGLLLTNCLDIHSICPLSLNMRLKIQSSADFHIS